MKTIHSRNVMGAATALVAKPKLAWAAAMAAAMVVGAQALVITPDKGILDITRWQGNETSQNAIDEIIAKIISPAKELYKQDVGAGDDVHSLRDSYQTTFSDVPEDPSGALIKYTPPGDIVGPPAYLLVKGGGPEMNGGGPEMKSGGPENMVGPLWYLYDLTDLGWNGTEDLQLRDFWPRQGAISHVTLYGTPGTSVPDAGGTLALLGLAAGLVGFARRKLGA